MSMKGVHKYGVVTVRMNMIVNMTCAIGCVPIMNTKLLNNVFKRRVYGYLLTVNVTIHMRNHKTCQCEQKTCIHSDVNMFIYTKYISVNVIKIFILILHA